MGCDPHSRAHSISPVVSSSRAGLPHNAPPPALTHTEGDGAVGMVTTIQDTLSRGPGLQALPRSHRAQKGPQPTVHVVFCLLIKLTSSSDRGWKCRLSRALVSSTRQLRVAKSRHIFGRWILDSPRKSRIQDIRILWFMGLIHTRCHLRQLFWGHEQQWSKGPRSHPGPATCPLCSRFLFWSLGVGQSLHQPQHPRAVRPHLTVPACVCSTQDCAMDRTYVTPLPPNTANKFMLKSSLQGDGVRGWGLER